MIVDQVSVPDRILEAAKLLAADQGWDAVRMGHIAEAAGVSRQTVYNVFGSKQGLAEQLVSVEVRHFMAGVAAALAEHDGDLRATIQRTVAWVLGEAASNPLIAKVVAGTHLGADSLLPHLTTRGSAVVETATAVIFEWAKTALPHADPALTGLAVDAVVRLTISHILLPGRGDAVPDQLAVVVTSVLGNC